jgi:predicted amidohydrolase
MPETLTVGTYQAEGVPGDVDANLAEMLEAMHRGAADGLELLVFPECFLTGYNLPGIDAAALPSTEDAIAQIGEQARRTGLGVVFGVTERSGRGAVNSALAISGEGEILARYRKRAMFGDWEKQFFTPGAGPALFDVGGFRIGLLICYDLEFPELARETAAAGAEIIIVPTSLMAPFEEVADHLVPTRALENQVFVAYANRTGAEHGMHYVGKSSICDPLGRVLAGAGAAGPAMIRATLQKSAIAEARARFSYLDDLRVLPRQPAPAPGRSPADRS